MNGELVKKNFGFEVKATDDSDADFFYFEGYASTFGNKDLGDDIVMPGAFSKSLEKRTPKILWQHDRYEPIGMPEEVREDDIGLFVRGKLPKDDTLVSGRVIPQFKVGSVSAMSIGFFIDDAEIREDGVRLLKELNLQEFSPVTFPMNESALINGFKSLLEETELNDEQKKLFLSLHKKSLAADESVVSVFDSEAVKGFTRRQLEKTLREAGFSRSAAQIVAKNFSEQGEPVGDDAEKVTDEQSCVLDAIKGIDEGLNKFVDGQIVRKISTI